MSRLKSPPCLPCSVLLWPQDGSTDQLLSLSQNNQQKSEEKSDLCLHVVCNHFPVLKASVILSVMYKVCDHWKGLSHTSIISIKLFMCR